MIGCSRENDLTSIQRLFALFRMKANCSLSPESASHAIRNPKFMGGGVSFRPGPRNGSISGSRTSGLPDFAHTFRSDAVCAVGIDTEPHSDNQGKPQQRPCCGSRANETWTTSCGASLKRPVCC